MRMVSRGRDSPASHRRSPTQQHEALSVWLRTGWMAGKCWSLRLFNCEERYHSASIRAQLDPEAQLALCDARLFIAEIVGGRRPRRRPRSGFPEAIAMHLSLIHISEPTRLRRISYAVFC